MGKWKLFFNSDTGIGTPGADLLGDAAQTAAGEGQQQQGGDSQGDQGGQGDHGGQGDQGDQSRDNNTGKEQRTWLPKGIRNHELLTEISKADELAQQYIDLKTKSETMVSIPGEDATDEARAAFYGKLGLPESADKYDLQYKEGIPEYLKKTLEGSEKNLRQRLHAAGVSQTQAAEVFNWLQEELQIGDQVTADFYKEQKAKAQETLKKAWGNDYEKNFEIAGKALVQFGDKEFLEEAKRTGIGNNPTLMRYFYSVGKAMQEDSFISGEQPGEDFDPDTHIIK